MFTKKQVLTGFLVLTLFIALSGIADAGFSGRSGGFSSGGSKSSSFSGSKSSSFSGMSKSASSSGSAPKVSSSAKFYGTTSTPKSTSSTSSNFFGTSSKKSLSVTKDTSGKAYTSSRVMGIPATKGTTKITSTTPKTYISGSSYTYGGRPYQHVYYGGTGLDFNSLLLMGFIMSHDDNGNVIYVNNQTGEYVTEEEFEDAPPESPGFESAFAFIGLLAIAYLVIRKD